ncbi:hypothetical protein [Aminicella lysinilytica]|uniref:Uncharacterized protein n=1 Tax=Aminicella lysinilytica TaxID=433323 RepID=A0A4R6QB98_9FIRM|nr:hypothetical protein [Aminicella lysinilytica]TDP59631.1 hypothetical protein EV211_10352 [Aminicella lysinilytica]
MRKLGRLSFVIIAACMAFICCTAVSHGTGGFSTGEIGVISASSNGVRSTLAIQASKKLAETGGEVIFSIRASTDVRSFTAYEGVHKRHAVYRFNGLENQRISINDAEHAGSSCTAVLGSDGRYKIVAMTRFVWETERGKVAEGFPRYFRYTVRSEPIYVTAADVDRIVNAGHSSDSKPVIVTAVEGSVGHTEKWDRNRNDYNSNCSPENRRGSEVFWSGEKFILTAKVTSADRPSAVTAEIEGTSYKAALVFEGGVWKGELFNRSMIERWGRNGSEKLKFLFTTSADGKQVTDRVEVFVDDRDNYWEMHRKE